MKTILLTLAIIVWSAPAHAQMFDATEKTITATINHALCRELPRLDAMFGGEPTLNWVIGAYGFGLIHGYAEGHIDEITAGQATKESVSRGIAFAMSPSYTPTSIGIIAANIRAYCSLPEHADATLAQAFMPFRDQVFRAVQPSEVTHGTHVETTATSR